MTSRTASTIVAGLLLMGPSGSAHARVTGITFEPRSPIVGHSTTAIATDDRKHEVARWIWTCTLADAGTSSPTTIKPTIPGRATLNLWCGGTYSVSLRVTYGGPMPPPPETVSVPLVIARPDDLELIKGFDTPAPYRDAGSSFKIRSQVRWRTRRGGRPAGDGPASRPQSDLVGWDERPR
jgi:hypothetical protein